MRIIEPHIHMYARTTDDYERMKEAGYVAVVEPAFWSGTDRSCAGSFFDYFRHLLEFEHNRAARFGIAHYCVLGVNAKEARHTDIAFEVLEQLPRFLEHPNCLGVGEVGFDLITDEEEEVLRRHIRIAEEGKHLVIIHSPHTNKRVGIERIFKVLEEEGAVLSRYIMDHNTEETIELTLSYPDVMCGITLYPTKVTVERAAAMIRKYGADRIVLNSSADWGKSYPLQLAEAAKRLPQLGVSPEDTEKVVYLNAKRFFSQSPKFKLEE